MQYKDDDLGFSFELPDAWHFERVIYNPSFPSARHFTSSRGMITVMTGEVEDSMIDALARERHFRQYLQGMGFTDIEIKTGDQKLGDETNVIFAIYNSGSRKECMISAVYKERNFLIRYEGDLNDVVYDDINQLMDSFRFFELAPTTSAVQPEEVNIDNRTWLKTGEAEGYTIYKTFSVKEQKQTRWWQFWKRWFS